LLSLPTACRHTLRACHRRARPPVPVRPACPL